MRMMGARNRLRSLLIAFFFLTAATGAQRGKAPPGFYPSGYAGDTRTGSITAVDESTREITLTAINRGKFETFVGVLADEFNAQRGETQAPQLALSKILIGWHARVFYLRERETAKLQGPMQFKAYLLPQRQRPQRFHLVFLLDVMNDPGKEWTGIITATDDATRQITLASGDGNEIFTGELLPGYQIRSRDGMRELKVSEITVGTKITVRYIHERLKVNGKEVRSRVIYRLEPPKA